MKEDDLLYEARCLKCQEPSSKKSAVGGYVVVGHIIGKGIYRLGRTAARDLKRLQIHSFIVDLARFENVAPIPDQEARPVTKAWFDEVISHHSLPRAIVTHSFSNLGAKS